MVFCVSGSCQQVMIAILFSEPSFPSFIVIFCQKRCCQEYYKYSPPPSILFNSKGSSRIFLVHIHVPIQVSHLKSPWQQRLSHKRKANFNRTQNLILCESLFLFFKRDCFHGTTSVFGFWKKERNNSIAVAHLLVLLPQMAQICYSANCFPFFFTDT